MSEKVIVSWWRDIPVAVSPPGEGEDGTESLGERFWDAVLLLGGEAGDGDWRTTEEESPEPLPLETAVAAHATLLRFKYSDATLEHLVQRKGRRFIPSLFASARRFWNPIRIQLGCALLLLSFVIYAYAILGGSLSEEGQRKKLVVAAIGKELGEARELLWIGIPFPGLGLPAAGIATAIFLIALFSLLWIEVKAQAFPLMRHAYKIIVVSFSVAFLALIFSNIRSMSIFIKDGNPIFVELGLVWQICVLLGVGLAAAFATSWVAWRFGEPPSGPDAPSSDAPPLPRTVLFWSREMSWEKSRGKRVKSARNLPPR